jgi:membrane protease YdiL (CAAX protease family)
MRTASASDTEVPAAHSIANVWAIAILVVAPLIGSAWLPPSFPHMLRQLLLFAWGVGATLLAERVFFSNTLREAVRQVGFVRTAPPVVAVTALASLPMWAFLPLFLRANGSSVALRPDWLEMLVGVVLVNGITEEVIHRGFVFGHLRRGRRFVAAATLSATLFAAQHLYLVATIGWTTGWASVLLAALLTFPLAYVFERGGNSVGGAAILHTSSNASVLVLAVPDEALASALVPHMAVVLVSLYLVFVLRLIRPLASVPHR